MKLRYLAVLVVFLAVPAACSRHAPPAGPAVAPDQPQTFKELGAQIADVVWNGHQVDRLSEFYAEGVVRHVPERPEPIVGLEANKAYVSGLITSFPDSRITVQRTIAEGDWGAMHWVWTGTHTRDLPGLPATGKKVRLEGISIVHLQNGKAVEIWDADDQLSMLQQLGVIPPLPPPKAKT